MKLLIKKGYFYASSKRTNSTDYFINNLNSVTGVYDLLIFIAETFIRFTMFAVRGKAEL